MGGIYLGWWPACLSLLNVRENIVTVLNGQLTWCLPPMSTGLPISWTTNQPWRSKAVSSTGFGAPSPLPGHSLAPFLFLGTRAPSFTTSDPSELIFPSFSGSWSWLSTTGSRPLSHKKPFIHWLQGGPHGPGDSLFLILKHKKPVFIQPGGTSCLSADTAPSLASWDFLDFLGTNALQSYVAFATAVHRTCGNQFSVVSGKFPLLLNNYPFIWIRSVLHR